MVQRLDGRIQTRVRTVQSEGDARGLAFLPSSPIRTMLDPISNMQLYRPRALLHSDPRPVAGVPVRGFGRTPIPRRTAWSTFSKCIGLLLLAFIMVAMFGVQLSANLELVFIDYLMEFPALWEVLADQ